MRILDSTTRVGYARITLLGLNQRNLLDGPGVKVPSVHCKGPSGRKGLPQCLLFSGLAALDRSSIPLGQWQSR